ncbi:MAG TPA: MBL fold metallo-hydrolase [Oligoflexia bacterium]|nr:MBL fold metallo-hydrolase [Oligoflexia bacterium]HMP26665.1 MBL fold metallo-hydrolase [Oligoflexia bacterium]
MRDKLFYQAFVVSDFAQNTRIFWSANSNLALIVDPGGDNHLLLSFLKENNLSPVAIWLTHSHIDHCAGVAELARIFKLEILGHPEERFFREKLAEIGTLYGLRELLETCPEPTRYLVGGEKLEFAGYTFEVSHAPGHSPGHLAFYCKQENLLISGDLVFAGSVGRTDLPGGDHKQLMDSIKKVVLNLPDDTKILSGHGEQTTVGKERASNPFLNGEISCDI